MIMRNLMYYFFLTIIISLSGCASSTKVMPMGPDTYTVTAQSEFGPVYAQEEALKKANAYAVEQGKHMIPVSVNKQADFDSFGDRIHSYELTFRIVSSTDPEYQRTNLVSTPDVIIKHENKNDKTPNQSNMYSELTQLKSLLDEGIITEEEYQNKKKEILLKY
jgi:hypothetical protein